MRGGRVLLGASGLLAVGLCSLLVVPFFILGISISPAELLRGLGHPLFLPALVLSLKTTLVSLLILALSGTPLAWWLGTSRSVLTRPVELLVQLPIVIPPAVVGIALLSTFGSSSVIGGLLNRIGLAVPFSPVAVLLAQLVVAAPFYVQAAATSFRGLDPDLLLVARTLGASRATTFVRVALPLSLPGLVVGASLAFARALGEFGATLLFAGNLPGVTQTLPLSILTALESDLELAVAFSLMLAALGVFVLLVLRRASPPGARWGRPRLERGAVS